VACLELFPEGASAFITVDGEDWGLSPVVVPGLPAGLHTVRMDRRGSQPWVQQIELAAGQSLRIDPPMAPAFPRVAPPTGDDHVWPLAVMIENLPEARPHYGLALADVVYEALAEGGISRFMALFMTQDADMVGPVRSTRHYFVYLAAEYEASLVHVGASPLGYASLGATRIRSVNESYGDPGFWRAANRVAPHNAFTATYDARAVADSKREVDPGNWGPLEFRDPQASGTGLPISTMEIRYPGGYNASYWHEPESNTYLRWMEGRAHVDALTGTQMAPKNVIVQVVGDDVIDRDGRLEVEQIGEGTAYYFVGGQMLEGVWSKASYGNPTIFWDTAGNRMRFDPTGPTWIQMVPPEARLSFS
jgi:hypothetical protein